MHSFAMASICMNGVSFPKHVASKRFFYTPSQEEWSLERCGNSDLGSRMRSLCYRRDIKLLAPWGFKSAGIEEKNLSQLNWWQDWVKRQNSGVKTIEMN